MLIKRTTDGWVFYCPACGEWPHGHYHVAFDKGWKFDGNFESPTITPSLKIRGRWSNKDAQGLIPESQPDDICHISVAKGMLQFHDDCTHRFRNQKVPMVNYVR